MREALEASRRTLGDDHPSTLISIINLAGLLRDRGKPDEPQPLLRGGLGAPRLPLRDDHPDYPALVIGNFILGGGSLSSRLADRVRQKDGLSYGIGSGLQTMSLDHRTAFYIYASCKPENMPKLRTAVRQEIDRLLKDGVTEQELEIAKRGYIQRQQVTRTNDGQLASLLEANMLADRDMSFTAAIEQKIGKLTEKQVVAAMRKHIKPDSLFIVEAGDFSEKPAPKTPKK